MNEDITATEVKQRIDRGDKFHLIDVREKSEYNEQNIGAKNVPLSELDHRVSEIDPIKNEEVVVHCRSGKRSLQAKNFLLTKGFVNVRNMTGGILEYLKETH